LNPDILSDTRGSVWRATVLLNAGTFFFISYLLKCVSPENPQIFRGN
jgi:hypothetical protein